ncbi:suppressor of lurcher protein 1 [Elysia marginata]|uniref:Suppressor of lurcher protein 1 n=1 Tax=Elysia marginata TaxID=1093978 RepID=A0AAV4FS85_9GAST|nr:suppressor of lurcher protein 1 [Elysia marginata]
MLKFLHMDLHFPRGDPNDPVDCGGSDSVTVYVIINGTTEVIDTWCGQELPYKLMSSQHKMIVEFRSYHSSNSVSGFLAHYSFVTNFGIVEGQQDNRGSKLSDICRAKAVLEKIISVFLTNNSLIPLHFVFPLRYSPKIVHLISKVLKRCDERSDYVSFSNFANSEDRKMTRLCGGPHNRVVWSDGPFFRVIFKSNELFDSTGFKAEYKFIDQEKKGTTIRTSEDETYSVHARRNSASGSRSNKNKRSDRGGGLLPLAPFTSLTFICPTIISLHFFPSLLL